jgi:NAD(P)-dependent dehydrogenase (short-subunit alcohol dehydrogenase family)
VSARTVVVTGSSSGIGAATVSYLRKMGCRVIGVDLHDAEVTADLATESGRQTLVDGVHAVAPAGIDGIVANAGVNQPNSRSIRVNYFGAIATLDGLRPLLRGPVPRAVLVASRAVLKPVEEELVAACLDGDEGLATHLTDLLPDSAKVNVYPSSKRAVARWLRRSAVSADWAGAGIPLNAVGPGSVRTAMTSHRTPAQQAEVLDRYPMPLGGMADAGEVAPVISWFLSPDNTKVTGQLLFVDGGGEVLMRGEDIWAGSIR